MTETIQPMYNWCEFAPTFGLVGLAVILLMADAFLPKFPKQAYAIAGAIGCAVAAYASAAGENLMDYFAALACVATGVCLLISYDYRKITCESVNGGLTQEGSGEFNILPLIATAGICALSKAQDLITLFVSLEVVTLSSYVLVGYYRRNQGSIEAGVKYLILGALSTGMLVFGAAWYFGMTGSFVLDPVIYAQALYGGEAHHPTIFLGFLMALCFLLFGAFFKVGAAPMHTWIPDVYQGAPTPISAFLAVSSKVAGLIALIVLLAPIAELSAALQAPITYLVTVMAVVGAATLLIGNLGAIPQTNAKRLLGYSSIGQAGFILAFFQGATCNVIDVIQYLLAYGLATLPAFCAIALIRRQRGSEEISAFRGLARTNPRLAFLITVCFASLAGVPLTAGFLVKLKAFIAILQANLSFAWMGWAMLIIMIICAAAGFYYYFKVIRAMYWEKPQAADTPISIPVSSGAIITICAILLIITGTMPLLYSYTF